MFVTRLKDLIFNDLFLRHHYTMVIEIHHTNNSSYYYFFGDLLMEEIKFNLLQKIFMW